MTDLPPDVHELVTKYVGVTDDQLLQSLQEPSGLSDEQLLEQLRQTEPAGRQAFELVGREVGSVAGGITGGIPGEAAGREAGRRQGSIRPVHWRGYGRSEQASR
jgi:hypothetical protein